MAILLAAVTGVTAGVSVDYDHEADFEKYKTFAIAFAEGQTNLETSSPLVHQTILENIKKHLVLRGLTEVKTDPDLMLTYHVALQDDMVLDTTGHGYGFGPDFGPGWGWSASGWGAGTAQMMSFTEGTVIIDAYDTGTKLGIWRGVMTEVVSGNIKKTRKEASRDIDKMFEKWAKQHEKDMEKAKKAKD
jgi:hypothetical protein